MLTPREKSPLPENVPRGGSNPRRCGQRAQSLPTELFRPLALVCQLCSTLHKAVYILEGNFGVRKPTLSFAFHFNLAFVHPLQDVALHQCLHCLLSVAFLFQVIFPFLCYVVLPSSAWSSPSSLPSPWLTLCAAFGPPIVLHSSHKSGPSPLLFQCVFYNVCYLCSFPDS